MPQNGRAHSEGIGDDRPDRIRAHGLKENATMARSEASAT
jgi:hypothetical protein